MLRLPPFNRVAISSVRNINPSEYLGWRLSLRQYYPMFPCANVKVCISIVLGQVTSQKSLFDWETWNSAYSPNLILHTHKNSILKFIIVECREMGLTACLVSPTMRSM